MSAVETFAGVGAASGLGGLAGAMVATAVGSRVSLTEAVGDSVGTGVRVGNGVSGTSVGPEHAVRVARITSKTVAAGMDALKILGSSIAEG